MPASILYLAAAITASVIQESGLRPTEYDVNAFDLHHMNPGSYFVNFTDDSYMYLIFGADMRPTLQEELYGIAHWVASNNLILNTANSERCSSLETPPSLAMERFGSLRILGVTITSELSVSAQVDRPACTLLNRGERSIYTCMSLSDESAWVARPGAKYRNEGYRNQPHPYYADHRPTRLNYANDFDKGRIQQIIIS